MISVVPSSPSNMRRAYPIFDEVDWSLCWIQISYFSQKNYFKKIYYFKSVIHSFILLQRQDCCNYFWPNADGKTAGTTMTRSPSSNTIHSQLLNIIILKFYLINWAIFSVLVQLYWECTGKYTPSRAGAIFSSTLPVELGVYWKI